MGDTIFEVLDLLINPKSTFRLRVNVQLESIYLDVPTARHTSVLCLS